MLESKKPMKEMKQDRQGVGYVTQYQGDNGTSRTDLDAKEQEPNSALPIHPSLSDVSQEEEGGMTGGRQIDSTVQVFNIGRTQASY